MKRLMAFASLALFAAFNSARGADHQIDGSKGNRSRVELATLAPPNSEGERLFDANCAICHADGLLYPGYVHLKGTGVSEPALSRRKDLDPSYVKQVARMGIGAMPAFSPTHLPDAELDQIAGWLTRKKT